MFSFTPDVDECSENMCAQLCVNYPGGYSCYCDGKKGFKLAKDQKSCEVTFCNAKLPMFFLRDSGCYFPVAEVSQESADVLQELV